MSELWEVVGSTWRLPIWITWHDSLGVIERDDCELLNCQYKARAEVLAPFLFERAERNWICKSDLQQVAHKSERASSEEVVEWLPARARVEVPKLPDNEFIQAYCASEFAISRDPAVMDAIWISFCKFGLHWLVNEEKEINFLFCRIIPLFLRKNWSNACAKWEREEYRDKRILRYDFMSPDPESIVARGSIDFLSGSRVTSYCPEKRTARPILEVIESEEYRAASAKRERARKSRWRMLYWTMFLERLKKQLPAVIEVYAHHLKEATHPVCKITENHGDGRKNQRRGISHSCSPDEASKHWMEGDVVPDPPDETGRTGPLQCPHGTMCPLSNLRPDPGPMRDTRPDVVECEDGQT